MTIDPKKVAKEAVGAIFDDYEDERIMSRDRWEAVVEKVVKSHVDRLKPGYGGYGVGAFAMTAFPPAGHVAYYGQPGTFFEPPLLPDED
jgi:hypothetical protein